MIVNWCWVAFCSHYETLSFFVLPVMSCTSLLKRKALLEKIVEVGMLNTNFQLFWRARVRGHGQEVNLSCSPGAQVMVALKDLQNYNSLMSFLWISDRCSGKFSRRRQEGCRAYV